MFDIFSHSVQQEADSIAIILSNKEKLSYKKVDEFVDLWAKYFIYVGIRQGNRVAVLTKNEDLHPFLHLALDKINATVVPLDTDIPTAQLATDIKKLNLNKIVIDKELCQDYEIPEQIKLHLSTQGIAPKNNNELTSVCLPKIERNSDIPNYIVASSGVSDNKKWIPINSSGLAYWAEVEKSLLKLSNKDKILCTRSPAYDARISEYVRSFAAGSTLVLMPQNARRDLNAIIERCEQEKITCLILIASQLAMPNQEELIQRLAKAGLTHLMVTGDACSMSLKKLCEKYSIHLWNCYGPTEATFGMSILCVNHEEIQDENEYPIVPIGFPYGEEVKFHLIDECLYIESPFLSPGYIDAPELTKKNFPTLLINNRWTRVFNTENKFLVKDNRLIFKGRIDNDAHIKVSGVKVDPYAIQQCIEKYNDEIGQDVLQVYVVVKPWLNNNKPFAYLVVQHEFSKSHFMAYLKKWLRKEELPIIVTLADFPRLIPSEKIDRRALIARTDHPDDFFFNEGRKNKEKFNAGGLGLEPSVLKEMDKFVEKIKNDQIERTNVEAKETLKRYDQLALCWCEILGLSESDEDQEFIFLGGDSTQLSKLVILIQQKIEPTFSYQKILNLPSLTLRQIRNSLQNIQQTKQTSAVVRALFPPVSDRSNYFFLPPLLGEGYFTYKELAQIFFSHYRFNIYGLSDPSIYDATLIPNTLEEAASRYVQAVKTIQPKGPYNLLGFSYGGTLAYYVAKQLLAQGDSIEALHLVDGFPPEMYQKLSAKDHVELLEELVNFVIQTLNNRFYDEKLKHIKLNNFDKLSSVDQINKSFDSLIFKVKKQESKALLMLARQHLLLMLETKEINKLPVWANLYLSTPNQTYLDVIYHIHKIVKKSAHCQSYFWNNYFEEVNLAGKRVEAKHLQLLKPQKTNFGHSAHIFWERAHDPLFNFSHDYFGPKPFYYLEKTEDSHSICHLYSLDWRQLAFFKNQLAKTQQVTHLHAYPLYDRIAEKYERKDRIYVTKYCISFKIPKEKIAKLQDFFSEKKISNASLKNNLTLSLPHIKDQQPMEHFFINLDIYWSGQYLMSLYFNCQGNNRIILEKILAVMKMSIDRFSELNNNLYNYSHFLYDIYDPSLFNAIDQISSWLNSFIILLLPYVEPPMENQPQQIMNIK